MSIPSSRRLSRRFLLVPLLLVLGIGLYAAFGFWVVPRIVQAKLHAYVEGQLHRQLRLGSVRCDPFEFTLELRDVAILERGREVVGFRRLFADYEATSFFASTHRLREFDLERPYARAIIRPDGSLNLAGLVPRFTIPKARIEDVEVRDGTIDFVDLRRGAMVSRTLAPITLRVRDFQTTRQSGVFGLALRTREGERLTWRGDLGLKPLASQGVFELEGLQARTVQALFDTSLPFVLSEGRFALAGHYVLAAARGRRIDATLSRLVATDVQLRMRRSDRNWVVPKATLDGIRLTLGRPARATVDRIVATGLRRRAQGNDPGWKVSNATLDDVGLSLDQSGITTVARIVATQVRRPARGVDAEWVFPNTTLAGLRLSLGRTGIATVSRIVATQLRLRMRHADEDWLAVPKATLDGTQLAPADREIAIRSLQLAGLDARIRRQSDGTLDVRRLFGRSTIGSSRKGPPSWKVRVDAVDVREAAVHLEDHAVHPAARLDLAPLSARITDVALDSARASPLTLDATVDGRAPLHVQGNVVPHTLAADLQVEVTALPLSAFLSYLPHLPALEVHSGDLAAKGTVSIRLKNASGPALRYDGDASVAHFRLAARPNRGDLVSWERVDLEGIALHAAPLGVDVQRIIAHRPFARVVVEPNRTLNLATLVPAPGPQAHARRGIPASRLPQVRVGELVFVDGTLQFADHWIQPHFQARIQALHGRITNVSTQPRSVARIDLSGYVIHRYSPVAIRGHMDLLHYDARTDLRMSFRNIELPIFNPYSGYFAGYAIDKGKLSTELHYRITGRQLVADHHLVISQLRWGEATGSENAVPLPVRTATSLLRDSHGVITLDLPVTGSLDDPAFRLGPVVWQMTKNVLGRVVSAPFRWLGNLFKGAEKAHYVDFAPGSAELSKDARSALSDLANSLKSHPELHVDIPAGPVPDTDVKALEDQRLQAAVGALRRDRDAGTPYTDLDDAEKIHVLKGLYVQEFGHHPRMPEAAGMERPFPAVASGRPGDTAPTTGGTVAANVEAGGATQDVRSTVEAAPASTMTHRERRASERHAEVAWLEGQLRPRFKAPPSAEADLAQARALAIQHALLADGALDPSRVFLEGNVSATANQDIVRMELAVE